MIIWGLRNRNKVLGQTQYPCQQCNQNAFHAVVRSRRWFTLFFIPIFPFSKKTTSRCNICGLQTQMENAQADAIFSQRPQVSSQVQ